MESISEVELLEELRAAVADDGPEDAFTAREWADRLGICVETTRDRIRPLIQAGKMEAVWIRRLRMDGIMQRVSAYRIVDQAA